MRKENRNIRRSAIGLTIGMYGLTACAMGSYPIEKSTISEQENIALEKENFSQEYFEKNIETEQFEEDTPFLAVGDETDNVLLEGQQIMDGEYIELLGTLLKREDGEIIVKLENPILFHGADGISEIASVGLTGWYDSAVDDYMLGKRVSVYGMVMEANTAYHYEQVMVVDGYSTLKLLNSARITRINNYSSNKQCTSYIIPNYDEEKQIGGTEYLPDGQEKGNYVYEYDENGNMVKEIWFNLDGTINYWNESDYDEQGNKLRLRHFSDADNMNYFYEFQYDEAGQCVLEVRYDPYGAKQLYVENEFDSLKLKVKSNVYNCNGNNMTHWIEFEYDSDGNCINEVWYQASGVLQQRIERQYE